MDKQYLDKSNDNTSEEQVLKQPKDIANSAQQEKMRKAQYLANYEQALGGALGSRLYARLSEIAAEWGRAR